MFTTAVIRVDTWTFGKFMSLLNQSYHRPSGGKMIESNPKKSSPICHLEEFQKMQYVYLMSTKAHVFIKISIFK